MHFHWMSTSIKPQALLLLRHGSRGNILADGFVCLAGLNLTVSVCKKITVQLIGAIGKQDDVPVQLEALDILSDMLSR